MSPKPHFLVTLIGAVFLPLLSAFSANNQITVVSWNVESGDAEPATIAQRIAGFQGIDIWGLSEVHPNDPATYESAAESGENADFARVVGTTGSSDRLVILFNTNRFEKLTSIELHDINVSGTVRAPLVVRLRKKDDGTEFLFMVNHLYRGDANGRHQQAQLLNAWARTQTAPIIAVGDYNFDWSVTRGDADHDQGYDFMTQNGVFTWVRPPTLVETQCSDRFDSVLDFVFTAGTASTWAPSAEIVVVAGDCPDNNQTSDHRPVRASFTVGGSLAGSGGGNSKLQMLQRISVMEAELAQLRTLVQQLP